MRKLSDMSITDIFYFIGGELTKSQLYKICKYLKEHYDINIKGLSVKREKTYLINSLYRAYPNKEQLVKAIEQNIKFNYEYEAELNSVSLTHLNEFDFSKRDQKLFPFQAEAIAKLKNITHEHKMFGYKNSLLIQLPTGAGKTRVANTFIRDMVLSGKGNIKRVLWVAPSHELLFQAAKELIEITYNNESREFNLGYVGSSTQLKKIISMNSKAKVVYSTLQSIAKVGTSFKKLSNERFDYIIIDEAHYAVDKIGHQMLGEKFLKATFICLSATPKYENKGKYICQYVYGDLYKYKPKILATCMYENPKTGINVKVDKNIEQSLIINKVNEQLRANDTKRCNTIAAYWYKNRKRLGKTLVFAID